MSANGASAAFPRHVWLAAQQAMLAVFTEPDSIDIEIGLALNALIDAGWTLKPPCVECGVHWPCRMVNDSESLGECALATAASGDFQPDNEYFDGTN